MHQSVVLGQLLRLSRVARLSWGLATLQYDRFVVSSPIKNIDFRFGRPFPFPFPRFRSRVSVFSSCPFFRKQVIDMVAQECTSTSRPQRDRQCSALCPHYVRTTPVVFPHRFRSISAIFPHCSCGISALLLLRSLSAPFPRHLRSLSALFPRSFRSLSAPFPQPFRIVSAVLGSFLQVLAIDHR